MNIGISRTTQPISFDTGIGRADYAEVMADPAAGTAQKPLMPGSTTVTQAIDALFALESRRVSLGAHWVD